MSSILKLLDELKNSESRKDVSERMMLSLLKEFHKPLEPSDFEKLSAVLSKLSVPDKISAVCAIVSLIKEKFDGSCDECYFLTISNSLLSFVCKIFTFLIEKSYSRTFNATDDLFSKTVHSALSLFIPLRIKSQDLGFSFMKACSKHVLTLVVCQRLNFSIRREATILYAHEVAECHANILKHTTYNQSSLLKDLVQWLPVCGDFQLQEAILEIAVYMSVTTADKLSTIKKWFANKDYESAVDSLSLESLSPRMSYDIWLDAPVR